MTLVIEGSPTTADEKDSRDAILAQAHVGTRLVGALRDLRESARDGTPPRLEQVTQVVHSLLLELREGSAKISSLGGLGGQVAQVGPEVARLRSVAATIEEELKINRIVFDSAVEMSDTLIRELLGANKEPTGYGRSGRLTRDRLGAGRILTRTV